MPANLKLIFNIETLIHTTSKMLIHTTSNIFTIFTTKTKKEQAINLCQKYFNSYDPFYYQNQKGTSNKFVPEIF